MIPISTYDNAAPLVGWGVAPRASRRCCDTWTDAYACNVCGNWLVKIPTNIELGGRGD